MQQLTTIAKVLALAQCLRISERTSNPQPVIRRYSHSSLTKFGLLATMVWLLPQLAWSQTPPLCIGDGTLPTAICQDITIDLDGTCNAEMGITYDAAIVDQENTVNDRFSTTSTFLGQDFTFGMTGKLNALVVECNTTVTADLTIAGQLVAGVNLVPGLNNIDLTALDLNVTAGTATNFSLDGGANALVLALRDGGPDPYPAGTAFNPGPLPNIDLVFQVLVALERPAIDNASIDDCALASLTASQTTFTAVGTPTVTLTATDKGGNIATCNAIVTVQDVTDPTISCPAPPPAIPNAASMCSATVGGLAPTGVADNCSPVTVTYELTGATTATGGADASGATFNVGTTLVTYTAVDASGNDATCSFNVVVEDTEDPTLTAPCGDITVSADAGQCEAVVSIPLLPFIDNCAVVSVTQIAGVTSPFPVGTSTVTFEATDAAGNTATCTFDVIVEDNENPVIACPADITQDTDNGLCTAAITWTPPVGTDNCPAPTTTQTAGPAPASAFPKGTTIVTYLVTDASGNPATCSFNVTVEDNEDPTFTGCPGPVITVPNTLGNCGATVTWTPPVANDNCPGVSVSSSHNPGDFFPVGTTTVTYTATDAEGNTATCIFDIVVEDTEDPQITGCPALAIVVPNDLGDCGAIVTWTDPTVSDNCTGESLGSTHNPGTFFNVGTTTVTYTATDAVGNTSDCSFDVTVNDTEDPVIVNCPADQLTVSVDAGECFASVVVPVPTSGVDYTDNCPAPTFINDYNNTANASDIYNVGSHTVKWTLTDGASNTATCSQTIIVVDDEDPTITCPADIVVGNDVGDCGAAVTWAPPTAADNCPGFNVVRTVGPPSGAPFPVGPPTTITYEVTDATGNKADCSFTVTVNDTEDPEITCSADFSVFVDAGVCGATVTYAAPIGVDNCPGATTAQIVGLGPGAIFPVGTTTETYEVTDAAGNTMSCSFNIEVVDNEDPVIVCPADIAVATDPGICGAIVTYTSPIGTDNCPGATTAQIAGLGSGATFPAGTTTETYEVTDAAGNTADCSFTITVRDDEDPTIVCPADITVSNDPGICGAEVTYTPPVGVDNCPGAITTQIAGLGSGATFPVGTTIEAYEVQDATGNTAECRFSITVTDDEDPVITCPPNLNLPNTPGLCGAVVNYTLPIATDNCVGVSVALTSGPTSGSLFTIGTTTVVYTATDASGNEAICSFTVTINDTQPPSIDCPAPITVFNDPGDCGAVVSWTVPTPTDNCPGVTLTNASHTPGSFFAVGNTTVTYEATDASGNTNDCSFIIIVNDGELPQITCPPNIEVDNDPGLCGAVVSYATPVGTDNCPGASTSLIAGLASGSTFPIGNTLVTYAVTDAASNINRCSFSVTVNDTEDPTITCPVDITVNNDPGLCGAVVTYTPPTGNDNCPGAITTQVAGLGSGAFFDVGTTTETYTVTDATGNTASCSFTITVNDNEPPTITCPAGFTQTNDNDFCGATITGIAPGGNDNCPGATFSYTTTGPAGFTSSGNPEDASGSFFPVGTTTVTYTHTDAAGNDASCSFNITITDDEAPDLNCPVGITVNTDPGACTAIVDYTVTAIDNCDGPIVPLRTAGSASGSAFNIGTHTITHEATDLAGNTSACTFDITVEDNEDPVVVACPGDITVDNDPGECGANIVIPIPTFGPTGNFNDNCPNNVTLINSYTGTNNASGIYPVGVTIVTWTVTDEGGNTVTCDQTITVLDAEDPVVNCPSPITQGVDIGQCGAIVTGLNPGFGDNCPNPTLTYELTGATTGTGAGSVDGFFFNVGTTTITYKVTDAAGNSVDCTTTVTIVDDEDPVIDCRTDLVVSNDPGECGAVVNGIAPTGANDNCPGWAITYTLSGATVDTGADDASGTIFNLGVTTVEYTITDAAGNTAICSFTVNVDDDELPLIDCPLDAVVDNDQGQCGAVVTGIAPLGFSDNCPGVQVEFFLSGATTGSGTGDASGTIFNVGVTTVTYLATDAAGNERRCNFTVTVKDVEDPQIVCPQDITIDADQGICGAQVIYLTPGIFDNCPNPTLTLTAGLPSGSTFPVGTTTVEYTATDASGNTAVCSFNVTVEDNEDPVIDCVSDLIVANDPGECGAVVNGIAPTGANDNCPGWIVTYTLSGATVDTGADDASGTIFNLGVTTVEYTITDAAGNTATCSFTVTVEDDEDPIISCPSDVIQNIDPGQCDAVVNNLDPNATDNCPNLSLSYILSGATTGTGNGSASGLTFNVGITTVEYTVTDGAGNTAVCSFTVTIIDNEDPTITCPVDIVTPADFGFCDALITGIDPIVSDNCPNPTITYSLTGATSGGGTGSASGTIFELGITTVTYIVTDGSGNSVSCSFTVTVSDIEDPIVICPGSLTIPLGTSGEIFIPTSLFFFTDNCGVASAEITPQTLDCNDLGSNLVTLTVTDLSGNTAFCSTTITVIDNQPPDLICPLNVTVSADQVGCTAIVNDIAPLLADDNCEIVSLTYTMTGATTGVGLDDASGNTFNVGTTTITYVATDAQGQMSQCSFTVTVEDTDPPQITCPDPVTQSTDQGSCSAIVTGLTPVSISDNCDPTLTLTYALFGATVGTGAGDVSGESFNLGVTTVTYTVTDDAGNQASCSFDVTIEDNTDPVLECPDNVTVEVTVGCDATVSGIGPIQAFDNCDQTPLLTYQLTGATVGQGIGDANGETFNLGTTTVTYTLEDANGNVSTCSFDVTVVDNIPPVITCDGDIDVVAAPGECGATVTYNPPVGSDNCPGISITQISGLGSGASFPVGTTTEEYQITDASGNTATCSLDITVTDEEDPVILCPAPIIVSVDPGECGAVVDYPGVSVADNCPNPQVSLISGLGDGAFFPVGVHTEVYEVADASGNTATCNFTVEVVDDEFPTVTCPQDLTVPNDPGLCSAIVGNILPIVSDNCPNWSLTYTLSGATTATGSGDASGESFNVGVTTVTYTVIDDAGNVSNCDFDITVEDVEAPAVDCPADVTVDVISTNDCFAVVNYGGVQTTDNCPGLVTITLIEGIEDGGQFPVGVTTVVYEAQDLAGNIATCSFTVTVNGPSGVTIAQITTPDPQEICEGDTLDLAANAPGALEAATWTGSNGGTFLPDPTDPNARVADLPAGLNFLTWTITDGCGVSTATLEVQVNPKPSGIIFETMPISAWNAADGVLLAIGQDGTPPDYSFLWNTGATTNSISGLGPDTYSVVVTDGEGCVSDTIFHELIAPPAPTVLVDVKVMLQGAYNVQTGLMDDNLRTLPDFPLEEPYTDLGFTHLFGGKETIAPAVLLTTGSNAVIDWIFVELRDIGDPSIVLSTRAALLLADGSVVDVDGISPVSIVGTPGDYHVAVRHRNHLGAMTLNPITLGDVLPAATVDFVNLAGEPTFGTNAMQSVLTPVRTLWAGNANGDTDVILAGGLSDVNPISLKVFLDPGNITFSSTYPVTGYHIEDVNMSGDVILAGGNSDVNIISLNVFLHPDNTTFSSSFPIMQQLP